MNRAQKRRQGPEGSGGGDQDQERKEIVLPDADAAIKKADAAVKTADQEFKKDRREKRGNAHGCCFD